MRVIVFLLVTTLVFGAAEAKAAELYIDDVDPAWSYQGFVAADYTGSSYDMLLFRQTEHYAQNARDSATWAEVAFTAAADGAVELGIAKCWDGGVAALYLDGAFVQEIDFGSSACGRSYAHYYDYAVVPVSVSAGPHRLRLQGTAKTHTGSHWLYVDYLRLPQGGTAGIASAPPPPSASVSAGDVVGANSTLTFVADPSVTGIALTTQVAGQTVTLGSSASPPDFPVRLNTSGLGDGTYPVTITATTAQGASSHATIMLVVDNTPPLTTPTVSATAGTNGWVRSDAQVTLAAADANGVSALEYRIDDGGWTKSASPSAIVTVRGDGRHVLAYRSVDRAGNVEPTQTLPIHIDATPPQITADYPASNAHGWHKADVTVAFSATDATSGLVGPANQTASVSAEGANQALTAQAEDRAGNRSAKTVVINLDKSPPTTTASLSGIAGRSGWYRSDVTVTLAATDNLSGVAGTEYSLDGGATWRPYTAPFAVAQEGKHTIRFRSADAAGNAEAAKSVEVWIDKTAPGFLLMMGEVRPLDDVSGPDETVDVSPPPASRTATVSIADAAGNLTELTLEMRAEGHQTGYKILRVRHGGNSVAVPKNKLKREIAVNRDGSVKQAQEQAEVEGYEIKAHYHGEKDVTTVEIDGQETIRSGRVRVGLRGGRGVLRPVTVP